MYMLLNFLMDDKPFKNQFNYDDIYINLLNKPVYNQHQHIVQDQH